MCCSFNLVLVFVLSLHTISCDEIACKNINMSAIILGTSSTQFSNGFDLKNVIFRNDANIRTDTSYSIIWNISDIDPFAGKIDFSFGITYCIAFPPTGYTANCSHSETYSEVQVVKELKLANKTNACIFVQTGNHPSILLGMLNLHFKYCNNLAVVNNQIGQNITIFSVNAAPAVYGVNGNCSCDTINATLYYGTGKKHPGLATCNETAHWNGCENAECWFDPTSIVVYQGSELENTAANFSCDFVVGYPNDTIPRFFLNDEVVEWNKLLSADDYNKMIQCIPSNFSDAKSDVRRVNVFFVPQNLTSIASPILLSTNDSQDVFFKFRAHANGSIFAEFYKTYVNGSTKHLPLSNTTDRDGYYNFISTIKIVSTGDYGNYTFFVETSSPYGNESTVIEVVEKPSSTQPPDGSDLPVPAIAASCAILVLIIILLVLFLIYRRRKNKKIKAGGSGVKEEKDNPLYGTSTVAGPATEYAMVNRAGHVSSSKEERLNPLYDSNTGAQGGVEEAYAAVDVRKKKKKNKADKGNENAAFSAESNAAVYAAVDKSKKKKNDKPPVEAVYSEVNKKKGSKNDTALHGSSQ